MSNVVSMFPAVKEPTIDDNVHSWLENNLYPWAEANGLDISSMKCKYSMAGIMALMKSMLVDG